MSRLGILFEKNIKKLLLSKQLMEDIRLIISKQNCIEIMKIHSIKFDRDFFISLNNDLKLRVLLF